MGYLLGPCLGALLAGVAANTLKETKAVMAGKSEEKDSARDYVEADASF